MSKETGWYYSNFKGEYKMNWLKKATMILLSVFILAACSTNVEPEGELKSAKSTEEKQIENESAKESTFPIHITMGDETITIKEKPQRILPLSLDVTEILLELVDVDRIVAISRSLEDPMISTRPEVGELVPERIASAVNIDPEQILSFDTDLLLLTKIHGQEADADKILNKAGIPILSFESMSSVESYKNNIKVVARAVGEEKKAMEIVETMSEEISAIQEEIPTDVEKPTVLVLSEVGPGTGPFILGPTNISYDLIKLAGGVPAVDLINLDRSTKAEVEQVIKMDPDYLFLLDWQGNGEESYKELMESPGWNTLKAVENEKVKIMPVKYLMNPNRENIEGLKIMTETIYGGSK